MRKVALSCHACQPATVIPDSPVTKVPSRNHGKCSLDQTNACCWWLQCDPNWLYCPATTKNTVVRLYRPRHFHRSWYTYPVNPALHSSEQFGDYLQQLPPFLPAEQVRNAFGRAALRAVMLSLARMAVCRLILARQNNPTQQCTKLSDRRSLQAVYLLANSGLAAWGVVALIPMLQSGVWQTSTLERVQGHAALGAFGSVQVGYSLWSIVTDRQNAHFQRDRFDEETVMLLHHLIIVFVGMLLATCSLGFRVYAPFFVALPN